MDETLCGSHIRRQREGRGAPKDAPALAAGRGILLAGYKASLRSRSAYQFGREYRITESDLKDFLKRRRTKPE